MANHLGQPILLRKGDVIGEQSIWHSVLQERSARLVGREPGLVATLSVAQLCQMADEAPECCSMLIRLITAASLKHNTVNLRSARAKRIEAATDGQSARSVFRNPLRLGDGSFRSRAAQNVDSPIATAPARLRKLLRERGFDGANVELICESVDFLEVAEGDVIIEAGIPWRQVVFLLDGTVRYEAWNYDVHSHNSQNVAQMSSVGSIALFGDSLLSDTSRVVMATGGVLAALSFANIESLSASSQVFAQRLTFFFGQSALRLSVSLDWAQCADDPDERMEEPHVFSVPFDLSISNTTYPMSLFDPLSNHGLDVDHGDAELIASLECLYRHKLRRYRCEEGETANLDDMVTFLRDEVSVREKEALFGTLVAASPLYFEFSEDDVHALAQFMTVVRFEQELSVVRRGELGSWFGILLTGTLRVEVLSGEAKRLRRGSTIGEMVPWQPRRVSRTATIKGHESGILATMLVSELRKFCEQHPSTAMKFMRLQITSALEKQHANLRAARATRLGPSKVLSEPSEDEHVDPSAPSILRKILGDKGFDEAEVDTMCDAVAYYEVAEGAVLTEAGQPWPLVVFLLRGAISFDAYDYTLRCIGVDNDGHLMQECRLTGCEGGIFNTHLICDSSGVTMAAEGTLAGLTFEQVDALCEDPQLSQKLLFILGQSAVHLTSQLIRTQSGGSYHPYSRGDNASHEPPSMTSAGYDLNVLTMATLPNELQTSVLPMESFQREKLLEQQRAAVGIASSSSGRGGSGDGGAAAMQMKLMAKMTQQKVRVLESENEAHRLSEHQLKSKLKKSKQQEKEATQLATRLLAPLETLHEELRMKLKDLPSEKTRLATVLNSTQALLEQHKYAFDWKAEIQRAEQQALGESGAAVSFWETVHKPTPLSAFFGTTFALGGLTLSEILLRRWGFTVYFLTTSDIVVFVGAFAALSALLFGAPAAPLGSPLVTVKGFALVVTLALILHWTSELSWHYTGYGLPMEAERVLAPAIGIAGMLAAKQPIHPPAAAAAVAYMELTRADQQWPTFLLFPVAFGVAWMLGVQLCTAKTMRYLSQIKASPKDPAVDADAKGEDKGGGKGGDKGGSEMGKDGISPAKLNATQPKHKGGSIDDASAPEASPRTGKLLWGAVKSQSNTSKSRRAAFASEFAASRRRTRRSSCTSSGVGSDAGSDDGASSVASSRFSSRAVSPTHSDASAPSTSHATSPLGQRASAPGGTQTGAGLGRGRWGGVNLAKVKSLDMV